MEVIVKRHCVGCDPDSGLSPLQKDLLDHPAPIRIAEAPTGAGKSYAFERAMARRGERVLFIVPTRRLAQNLLAGLLDGLVRGRGWSEEVARGKLALWSSDATSTLRAEGIVNVGARRIRQIFALDPTRLEGEMIVAVPETVSGVLLRLRRVPGLTDAGVFDLLSCFEHIVFDEFHTIAARGFGLAGLIAKLAAQGEGVRAKVSFLSATPLDIQPVLRRLDVPEDRMAELHEQLTDQGRAVHGDVRLKLLAAPRMVDLVNEHVDSLIEEVGKRRQVVVIYDALRDLIHQLPLLREVLLRAGIGAGRSLLMNSISDTTTGDDGKGFFAVGREQLPESFDVLVATASVEMGVTFRANLLFMEPGFEPMNFLQRYGRAARGDHSGIVVVRWDETSARQRPWMRDLRSWMEERDGCEVNIQELTTLLAHSVQLRFEDRPGEDSRSFGRLPRRAAYAAGLYWKVLMDHWSTRGARWERLRNLRPKTASAISRWIKEVRTMESDRILGRSAKRWCDGFEAEARTLRDIGTRLRVIDSDGRTMLAPELWLRRNTEILDRFPITFSSEGGEEVVHIDGNLDDWILEKKSYVPAMKRVLFPHTPFSADIRDNSSLVDEWCWRLKDRGGAEAEAWDEFPEAMACAEKLVRLTGLVVCDDMDVESVSGVL